jgi:hypothetical protein
MNVFRSVPPALLLGIVVGFVYCGCFVSTHGALAQNKSLKGTTDEATLEYPCESQPSPEQRVHGATITAFEVADEDAGKRLTIPDHFEEPIEGGTVLYHVCLDREGEIIDAWIVQFELHYENAFEPYRFQVDPSEPYPPESYLPEMQPYLEWLFEVIEETSFTLVNESVLYNENLSGAFYVF